MLFAPRLYGLDGKDRSAGSLATSYLPAMTIRDQPLAHKTIAAPHDEERLWQAVVARDKALDGTFYYSVETTGVYCRPSCPSRRARRENVRFHATAGAAEAAGFRPCKRCRPAEPSLDAINATRIAAACRLIEAAEAAPSLESLARASGLSRFHFHRIFKAVTGVTPKAYAAAHRQRRVRDSLIRSKTVTNALHDAGFNSSSRFYAATDSMLGMTPSSYRAGGAGAEIALRRRRMLAGRHPGCGDGSRHRGHPARR